MSQLVACKTAGGLLIAADRRVEVREEPHPRVHRLRKLFALGPTAALATGGAAVGIEITRTLSHLLARRSPLVFEELEPYVRSVFQDKFDGFARAGADWFAAHPDAPQRSCFLLGGRSLDGSYRMAFYTTERHEEPYRSSATGDALCMPRRLGLETRLAQGATAGQSVRDAKESVITTLRKIAAADEAVGGPFDLATFEGVGVTLETVEA